MARILAVMAAVLFLLPISGTAQVVPTMTLAEADRIAIRHVIEAQLSALQHDESALAFSYASPMIQRRFGTPEVFLNMVKMVYPTVYRPRDIQFREIEFTRNGPMQKVFFFGPDGEPVLGLFYMQQLLDESWKVNGCELVAAPDISI